MCAKKAEDLFGNPGEFTMLELAQKVIEFTGSASEIEYRELPQVDPTQRRPDVTLADAELRRSPTVALDEAWRRRSVGLVKAPRSAQSDQKVCHERDRARPRFQFCTQRFVDPAAVHDVRLTQRI